MHGSGNQSVIASVHIFDTIAASMRAPNKIFYRNVFSFLDPFPATTKKLTQPYNCIVH